MICDESSRVTATDGIGPSACQSRSASCQTCAIASLSRHAVNVVADQHDARVDERAHAFDELR